MLNTGTLIGLALGMRHGTDPDHLAAIDGLARIRPRPTNGIFFALGHGLFVMLLAVGVGRIVSDRLAGLGPWVLILIGAVNLWRLLSGTLRNARAQRPVVVQPLVLGVVLAAGFETSSQLATLLFAGRMNPWILGAAFSTGMVAVDGLDGYFAASTQRLAENCDGRGQAVSRLLGIIVVVFSFGLGGAELLGVEIDRFVLPLGLALFGTDVGLRLWARSATRDREVTGLASICGPSK